jgi:hypothetical protein
MTMTIRRRRAFPATLVLAAVLLSVPAAPTQAAIQRDSVGQPVTRRVCPIDWRQSPWHVKQLIRCAATHYGLSPGKAVYVAWRESRFSPIAYNPSGRAAGIYQHLLRYWPERAQEFGFRNWSVFNARANIIVTMRMVQRFGWGPWGG